MCLDCHDSDQTCYGFTATASAKAPSPTPEELQRLQLLQAAMVCRCFESCFGSLRLLSRVLCGRRIPCRDDGLYPTCMNGNPNAGSVTGEHVVFQLVHMLFMNVEA